MYDEDLTADEKVAAYVLSKYRTEAENAHLANCPEKTVKHVTGSDGEYGCDTGCEYLRFEVDVTCPHGESESFEYGDFGEMAVLIEAIHDPGGRYSWML